MKINLSVPKRSKSICFFASLPIFLGYFAPLHSQNDGNPTELKQVATIRALYQDTNARIAEMEKHPAESTIYTMDLVVNSGEAPYPAVGTYKERTRFYYTFGDREKNPYPDLLLKIETKTNRAARIESAEYLFNLEGQLVFCFEKNESETRYYFEKGKIIRLLRGEAKLSGSNAAEKQMIATVQARAKKLVQTFRNSL